MPLPKRVVDPAYVARGTLPTNTKCTYPSELEAVTNGTLANVIRQLSSLSRHAEDMFGELLREAEGMVTRASSLQVRIERLSEKVASKLESTATEVSPLMDIQMRKAFKSSNIVDQQVVSRDTIPTAMLEMYQECDRPPPLDKLNPYRDDGKDGLKFYTDPNYFFELWKQEMLSSERIHGKEKKPHRPKQERGHRKKVRQPHDTKEKYRQLAIGHGEILNYQNPQTRVPPQGQVAPVPYEEHLPNNVDRPSRPISIELRKSYTAQGEDGIDPGHMRSPTGDLAYTNSRQYPPSYNEAQAAPYPPHPAVPPGPPPPYSPTQEAFHSSPQHNQATPSRNVSRVYASRPTQPPPAPPSANNSASSTPTAGGTPTRARGQGVRENLPPPPPPPGETAATANGPILPHLSSRIPTDSPVHNSHVPAPPHLVSLIHQNSRENTPEPPPPPLLNHTSAIPDGTADLPPPPPPPNQVKVDEYEVDINPPPPPPQHSPPGPSPPPPPPPPPLPNGPAPAVPLMNGDIGNAAIDRQLITSPPKSSPPKSVVMEPKQTKPTHTAPDVRSDLLKAIRDGITLRKVEKIEQKETDKNAGLYDVASILARRVALELSDSSGSESEEDSDQWDEETSA